MGHVFSIVLFFGLLVALSVLLEHTFRVHGPAIKAALKKPKNVA